MPTGSVSPITSRVSSSPAMRHALDRALGGAHAAPDLGRLEGRAGRRRGRDHALLRAERDLGVRADVDEEPHPAVAGEAGREHARDDVAAHVGAERGEGVGRRARVQRHAVVGGGHGRQPAGGDDERRHRQRLGVDPERDLGHGDVAADDHLVHPLALDARLGAHLGRRAGSASRPPAPAAPRARRGRASSPTRARSRRRRRAAGGSASSAPRAAGRWPGRAGSRPPWSCPGRTRSRAGRRSCRPARRRSGGRRR